MNRNLRLTFGTEDSAVNVIVRNPREVITQDEAKTAMEAILASGAFEGFIEVSKAVEYVSDHTVIYEA